MVVIAYESHALRDRADSVFAWHHQGDVPGGRVLRPCWPACSLHGRATSPTTAMASGYASVCPTPTSFQTTEVNVPRHTPERSGQNPDRLSLNGRGARCSPCARRRGADRPQAADLSTAARMEAALSTETSESGIQQGRGLHRAPWRLRAPPSRSRPPRVVGSAPTDGRQGTVV